MMAYELISVKSHKQKLFDVADLKLWTSFAWTQHVVVIIDI